MSPKGVSARGRGRQLRQVWATKFCLNLQIDVWLSRASVEGATSRGRGGDRGAWQHMQIIKTGAEPGSLRPKEDR